MITVTIDHKFSMLASCYHRMQVYERTICGLKALCLGILCTSPNIRLNSGASCLRLAALHVSWT